MKVGPELDSLIARKLWKVLVVYDPEQDERYMVGVDHSHVPLPPFSSNLEEAHRIVGAMKNMGFFFQSRICDNGCYEAAFTKPDGKSYLYSFGKTLPEVICHSALSALDGSNRPK